MHRSRQTWGMLGKEEQRVNPSRHSPHWQLWLHWYWVFLWHCSYSFVQSCDFWRHLCYCCLGYALRLERKREQRMIQGTILRHGFLLLRKIRHGLRQPILPGVVVCEYHSPLHAMPTEIPEVTVITITIIIIHTKHTKRLVYRPWKWLKKENNIVCLERIQRPRTHHRLYACWSSSSPWKDNRLILIMVCQTYYRSRNWSSDKDEISLFLIHLDCLSSILHLSFPYPCLNLKHRLPVFQSRKYKTISC